MYLLLVPFFLTPRGQGLWFTIMSLGALLIFFADLGFAIIITQFAAHEFAHLRLLSSGCIEGSEENLKKLADLLYFCVTQIKYVALFLFPVILVINFSILSYKTDYHEWLISWILYNLATGLLFANNIFLSFIEGCDQIVASQKIRVKAMGSSIIVTGVGLALHADLFVLGIAAMISSVLTSILLYQHFGVTFRYLLKHRGYYRWSKEIYSLLRKYAGSLVSGYFTFQCVTLLALNFYGPIAAGKVGLSVMIWTTLMGISNVWLTVNVPRINMHVSRQEYLALNLLFRKALKRATMTYLGGGLVFGVLYFTFGDNFYLFKRIVSINSMMLIAIGWFGQILVNAMTVYIRAHKEEALLINSIATAVYIFITTIMVCLFLPFKYFFVGFFSSYLFCLPWAYRVFARYYFKVNNCFQKTEKGAIDSLG